MLTFGEISKIESFHKLLVGARAFWGLKVNVLQISDRYRFSAQQMLRSPATCLWPWVEQTLRQERLEGDCLTV